MSAALLEVEMIFQIQTEVTPRYKNGRTAAELKCNFSSEFNYKRLP